MTSDLKSAHLLVDYTTFSGDILKKISKLVFFYLEKIN